MAAGRRQRWPLRSRSGPAIARTSMNQSHWRTDMSNTNNKLDGARRCALRGTLTVLAAAVLATFGTLPVVAQVPALPKSPVTINVVDVAGNLALTQDAFEAYRAKHPELVAKFNFTK